MSSLLIKEKVRIDSIMVSSSKEKTSIKGDGLIRVLFLIYMLFLVWAVLWKFNVPYIGDGTLRLINLSPFDGNSFPEMRFNILIFVPFGFYISVLAPKGAFIKQVLMTLLASALLEASQYILAIGRSDVTDLILNTLGGIAGIAVIFVLSKLFGKNTHRTLVVVCVVITALVLAVAGFFVLFGRIRIT